MITVSAFFRHSGIVLRHALLGAGLAMACAGTLFGAEEPPYASLDRSLTTVKGIGDEIEIITTKTTATGERQYFGLMRNGEAVIFTGEVTQITGDWHLVHFFRDRNSLYLLTGQSIAKIPGIELSAEPFRVVEVDRKLLPDEFQTYRSTWRGISFRRKDGTVEEVWSEMGGGKVYFPGPRPELRNGRVEQLEDVDFPHVTLPDYRSWHAEKILPANEARISFQIFATTPDPARELLFDSIELRPGKIGFEAFTASRSSGKLAVRRSLGFFHSIPRYFLSTVYRKFQEQTDRPAFDEKLMAKIQHEDKTLGLDRLIYVWAQEEGGRIPGGIRLFQGFDSENFITKDIRLPVERSHPHLDIRGKFPGETKFFELNRLAVRKEISPSLDTKRILSVLSQYLEARKSAEGRIILHTDEVGVSLFGHLLGAEVLYGPAATGDRSYVLTITTETLRSRMIPHSPGGRPIRRLRLPNRWCDWVFTKAGPS